MKYLTFKNGDKIPMLGLGTWKAEKGQVHDAIINALKMGYRHFDCAHIYQNEEEIGQAFQTAFDQGLVKREDLWITSKLWNNSHNKEEVEPAIRRTLENLQLNYLDLYLVHWPIAYKNDFENPQHRDEYYTPGEVSLGETWSGMIQAKRDGLAKHIGVSNFNIHQIKQIIDETQEIPEMNQIESHPYLRQEELKEHADSTGYFLTAYKPIGSGGRVTHAMENKKLPNLFENEVIQKIARDSDATEAQVLLAWQLQRGIIVIPKSVHKDRQQENLNAINIHLNDDQMQEINALDEHLRFVDGIAFTENGSPYNLHDIWGE
ncbi:aldo/keto reductase [Flavobacteriaceae bacterium Ap0902]|nr:aldo/keto reductase [Flavobacteriaceae bacterium Ap0902]